MKKLFFYMVAAAIALTSCSSEDVVEVNNNGNAIDFRVAMGPGANSRGEETTQQNLNQMFVTAVLSESGDNYFENELYTRSGDAFITESSVDWYWPLQALNFYAYGYGVKGGKDYIFSLSTDDDIKATEEKRVSLFGNVIINKDQQVFEGFTPNPVVSDQIDFVTASATGTRDNNKNTGVELTFDHALSQIQIQGRHDNANYNFNIYGVKIANVVTKDNFNMYDGSWANSYATFTKVFESTNPEDINCGTYTITYDEPVVLKHEDGVTDDFDYTGVDLMNKGVNGAAMLIPQKLTEWNHLNAANGDKGSYLAVFLNITTAATNAQVYPSKTKGKAAWAVIPIDTEWEKGYKYIYVLTFNSGAGYDEETGDKILDGTVNIKTIVKPWLPESDDEAYEGEDAD